MVLKTHTICCKTWKEQVNLEITGSDSAEGDENSVHPYDTLTLRLIGKRNGDLVGVNPLNSREPR